MDTLASNGLGDSGVIRYKPEEAQERYGIKKGAYYERLRAAGLRHQKDAQGSFLDAAQLDILDKLEIHLGNGGSLADFSHSSNNKLSVQGSTEISSAEELLDDSMNVSRTLAEKLDQSAQEVAASYLASARNRLTAEYLFNPDRLDSDLQSQIFPRPNIGAIDQEWAGHHMAEAIRAIRLSKDES